MVNFHLYGDIFFIVTTTIRTTTWNKQERGQNKDDVIKHLINKCTLPATLKWWNWTNSIVYLFFSFFLTGQNQIQNANDEKPQFHLLPFLIHKVYKTVNGVKSANAVRQKICGEKREGMKEGGDGTVGDPLMNTSR